MIIYEHQDDGVFDCPDEMDIAKYAAVDCTCETFGDAVNKHFKEIKRELVNLPM